MMNTKLVLFDREEELTNAVIAHLEIKQHEVNSEYPVEIQKYYSTFYDDLSIYDSSHKKNTCIPTMLETVMSLPADLFCEGCLILLFRCIHRTDDVEMIIGTMESIHNLELDSRSFDQLLCLID